MTKKFRNRYRVESVRKKGFDYSRTGSYFITICTRNKEHLFGKIINSDENNKDVQSQKMILNDFGEIVKYCWFDLPNHYPHIILDEFIIMPDHIHGIIHINNPFDGKIHHGLPEFVRALKSFSSRRISEKRNATKPKIWQPGYYDHIINGHDELINIRNYINKNPDNLGCLEPEILYKLP
jgi:REP element-mobilizing transposase RayT